MIVPLIRSAITPHQLALASQPYSKWSKRPTESNRDVLILAIDPGISGWVAAVNRSGIRCARPILVDKVRPQATSKTRRPPKARTQINYTAAVRYIKSFRAYCRRKNLRGIVVYETINVIPGNDIVNTVTQHLIIQTWPMLCAAFDVECYPIYANDWKRKMNLPGKDKAKSIVRLKELCPDYNPGNSHDLAEACLLGHYFLKHESIP